MTLRVSLIAPVLRTNSVIQALVRSSKGDGMIALYIDGDTLPKSSLSLDPGLDLYSGFPIQVGLVQTPTL